MKEKQRCYLCIDLKSFYASVECVERGLDTMTTNLVVADPDRAEGTICLAVSPAMKALGVKNRCRVYEIPKHIKYIMAPPRMQKYIDYSARIYGVYLNYIEKEDIHVYSIDEAFIDVTEYLGYYHKTPVEMGKFLMDEVLREVGVRATCGVGTNLFLTKVALDITAKHSPDFIGYLDEKLYREKLWDHTPLTDFWRIGDRTARKLSSYGYYTMGDIANGNEDLLYRKFGIDAELLIDHAWGRESTEMKDIKAYKPQSNSLSSGQVLLRNYTFDEAIIIVKEMLELLCLDLVDKKLLTSSVSLHIGYSYEYEVYPTGGTLKLPLPSSSFSAMSRQVEGMYSMTTHRNVPIRQVHIGFGKLVHDDGCRQLTFDDEFNVKSEKEKSIQNAMLRIKKKYGKNAILKGSNFLSESTMRERNSQIGGHKSGA